MARNAGTDELRTDGEEPDPWPRLQPLWPFFQSPPIAPEPAASILEELPQLRRQLLRSERRLTFIGAFKAGKTSLVNALLGAPLLPAGTGRSRNLVAAVGYGASSTATAVTRAGPQTAEHEIPFDTLPDALSISGQLHELRLAVPAPLLAGGWTLVDTPGLLQNPELTRRALGEVERADLAVMVLAADKALSKQERDQMRLVQGLLNGNVVSVINRLDAVEEGEREEVVAWVAGALRGSGNRLVGEPGVFAVDSRTGHGIPELRGWLQTVTGGALGEQIAVLSRLGILDRALGRLAGSIGRLRDDAQQAALRLRQEQEEAVARERAAIQRQLAEGRVRLRGCEERLGELGERFVQRCLERTRTALRLSARSIHVPWGELLSEYAGEVSDEVRAATLGLPITVPPFSLADWIVHGEIAAASHPTAELTTLLGDAATRVFDGGSAGREAGASAGSWLARNVFGVDVEQETLRRAETRARGLLSSLTPEARSYIARIEGLLEDAEQYYAAWSRGSPRLTAAAEREERLSALVDWIERFRQEVRRIAQQLLEREGPR